MNHLAELTKQYVLKGNFKRVNDCFTIAEHQLRTGTWEMKNAVVNSFLFSYSFFMEMNKVALNIPLPELLEREYVKQVNTFGV